MKPLFTSIYCPNERGGEHPLLMTIGGKSWRAERVPHSASKWPPWATRGWRLSAYASDPTERASLSDAELIKHMQEKWRDSEAPGWKITGQTPEQAENCTMAFGPVR